MTKAFDKVLGSGAPGTMAYVRCLTLNVVEALAAADSFADYNESPPTSTMNCPHLMQRYATTPYNVMPTTGRLGNLLGVIHAGWRVRVRIIHAEGMSAFSSSGAEDANLFTEANDYPLDTCSL